MSHSENMFWPDTEVFLSLYRCYSPAEELGTALGMVGERFSVAAAGIASYDPVFDAQGNVLGAALACVEILTGPDE